MLGIGVTLHLTESIPGIIVGVTTPEKVDFLYEIAQWNNNYLKNSAIRSLIELKKDSNQEISSRARYYLNKLSIDEKPYTLYKDGVEGVSMRVIEDKTFILPFIEDVEKDSLLISIPKRMPEMLDEKLYPALRKNRAML